MDQSTCYFILVEVVLMAHYSWDDLKLVISTPRALKLALLTLSTPRPQQRNKGKKYTSSKISMNVHFDFGFSFYAMRCCCDKTLRKNGRLGTPHPKPAEGLLLLRRWNQDQGIEFNAFFLWIEQQMIDFGLLSTNGTTLDCFQPSGTILVHIGLIITILGHFLTWFSTFVDCF